MGLVREVCGSAVWAAGPVVGRWLVPKVARVMSLFGP